MMQPKFNYNLSEELFKSIEDQFGGVKIAEKYLNSKDDSVFDEWGKNLMEKAYELGTKPEFNDHLYEMVQMVAKKTGEVRFPHEAQRFIEIACLSIHLMSVVLIQTAYNKELSFSIVEGTCTVHNKLKETLSEEELKSLPCKGGCKTAWQTIFNILKMDDVEVSQTQEIPSDGMCTFLALKK
ncbi:hypothetical protein LCGC14_2938510 [marine sediment metagenome]|uniref:4-vinyl reductase 4VR domain-containing protein n=1 Tax=marine sediment metagenome TaxID=412755 RepID=A0A0F9A9T6_9ZZZZ|nr:hypothetical protein [archaeon]